MSPELSGIVIVDKPGGISSAGVVSRVKALFGAKKAGHTGTLDPFATGVLICCINQATRLARFFLKGDKTYVAELVLGAETDTQDATGTVVRRRPLGRISEARIRTTAARFVGQIEQIPPIYSALKHHGKPLYEFARRGVAVTKPARRVQIHRIEIVAVDLPAVRMRVSCSSGTYIRTLCHDLGRQLGCGGHLNTLRRTSSCGFSSADAISLDALARYRRRNELGEALISMASALPFIPTAIADAALAHKIHHGRVLSVADFKDCSRIPQAGIFQVTDARNRLLAVLSGSPDADRFDYCCVFPKQGG